MSAATIGRFVGALVITLLVNRVLHKYAFKVQPSTEKAMLAGLGTFGLCVGLATISMSFRAAAMGYGPPVAIWCIVDLLRQTTHHYHVSSRAHRTTLATAWRRAAIPADTAARLAAAVDFTRDLAARDSSSAPAPAPRLLPVQAYPRTAPPVPRPRATRSAVGH